MPPLGELLNALHARDQPYADRFDDRLLITVLLALAAGQRSIVLRASPARTQGSRDEQRRERRRQREDWVRRAADEVAWICSTIFALPTHRVNCSPKLSANAFLKSLFLPLATEPVGELSASRKDIHTVRGYGDDTRRTPNRSLTGPLEVSVAKASDGLLLDQEGRRARSPSKVDARRQQNASESLLPSSAPPTRLSFSDLTGPSPDDGESSAGEDLYPSSPYPKSASMGRRSTLSPRVNTSPSPERRRMGARRHTLGARDLARSLGQAEEMIGLGVNGLPAPNKVQPPPAPPGRQARPAPSRSRESSASFASRSPIAQQHASYLQQADRRPSIASIQSGFSAASGSTALPPTPTASRFLSPSPSSPRITPQAQYSASPLASSPPASPPSPSRPPPRTASARTASPSPRRLPSSTYPPVSRPPPSVLLPPPHTSANAAARVLPQVLILEHLERARPSAQHALLGTLRDRRVVLSPSNAHGAASAGTSVLLPRRRAGGAANDASSMRTRRTARTAEDEGTVIAAPGAWEGTWNLPEGFVCVAVVWEEEDGGEGDGGWGGVSRHLLDRFALSCTVPPASLLSASRFHAPPLHPLSSPPRALLAPLPLPEHALPAYIADTLDTYTSDLISALRHHPQLDGRMLTAVAVRELRLATRVWAALSKGDVLSLSSADAEKEDGERTAADALVLPADVLAVALFVLGHRLALRRPEDEKSTFWGSELFLYPIKGLRPLSVQSLELAQLGAKHDRRFVLVSPKDDGSHECYLTADYPAYALLRQSIDWATQTLTITPTSGDPFSVALSPPTVRLTPRKVELWSSPTLAYDLGDDAAAFFTRHTGGKDTRLCYLEEGANANRKVLGSIADGLDKSIAFQDCASYMIASSASLAAFSAALGRDMPMMPLRPNIVVGPARPGGLKPWVEDWWKVLRVGGKSTFRITSNCVRCVSLNIDYETGKRLEGTGLPLQTLAKDRRVDSGSYSPVFGRYGFSEDVGHTVSVGDKVAVTKLYKERTTFQWPGI
ncbi:hypothetical protein JCM10449v2_007921 [Rhodotorula kratochvilovae]